jgi:hypothetical protein
LIAGISAGSVACSGSSLVFLGSSIPSSPSLTWQWDLGNNVTSGKQNPDPVVYTNPGPQPVSLVVSNGFAATQLIPADILPIQFYR